MGVALFLQQRWVNPKFTFAATQIAGVCIFFSLAFELIAPRLTAAYTADWVDVIAYAAGAIFFGIFQNHAFIKLKL